MMNFLMEKLFCRIAVQFLILQLSLSPCAYAMNRAPEDAVTTMGSCLGLDDLRTFSLINKSTHLSLKHDLALRCAKYRSLLALNTQIKGEKQVKKLIPLVKTLITKLPKNETYILNNKIARYVLKVSMETSHFSETREKIELLSNALMIPRVVPPLARIIDNQIGTLLGIVRSTELRRLNFVEYGGMILN